MNVLWAISRSRLSLRVDLCKYRLQLWGFKRPVNISVRSANSCFVCFSNFRGIQVLYGYAWSPSAVQRYSPADWQREFGLSRTHETGFAFSRVAVIQSDWVVRRDEIFRLRCHQPGPTHFRKELA